MVYAESKYFFVLRLEIVALTRHLCIEPCTAKNPNPLLRNQNSLWRMLQMKSRGLESSGFGSSLVLASVVYRATGFFNVSRKCFCAGSHRSGSAFRKAKIR